MPERQALKQIKPKSLDDYLEVMSKAVFHSGISWQVVDKKWPGIREAFRGFDTKRVAAMTEDEMDALGQDDRVIRHRGKLDAVAANARRIVELEREHGSFRKYLRAHGSFEDTVAAMKRDFKFLGLKGCYFFLYVVGEEVPPHDEFEKAQEKA